MQHKVSILCLILMLHSFGCAPTMQQSWHSIPAVQTIFNPAFEIQMEPLKLDKPYYVSFRLTIRNNTAAPIEIDWNNTRYLHKGQDRGLFVFKGIDPQNIQGAIAPDVIPAGEIFFKEISPLRTIAIMPRHQRPEAGQRGFIPGVLPAGENSILLVIRQKGQVWHETLSVRLHVKARP